MPLLGELHGINIMYLVSRKMFERHLPSAKVPMVIKGTFNLLLCLMIIMHQYFIKGYVKVELMVLDVLLHRGELMGVLSMG